MSYQSIKQALFVYEANNQIESQEKHDDPASSPRYHLLSSPAPNLNNMDRTIAGQPDRSPACIGSPAPISPHQPDADPQFYNRGTACREAAEKEWNALPERIRRKYLANLRAEAEWEQWADALGDSWVYTQAEGNADRWIMIEGDEDKRLMGLAPSKWLRLKAAREVEKSEEERLRKIMADEEFDPVDGPSPADEIQMLSDPDGECEGVVETPPKAPPHFPQAPAPTLVRGYEGRGRQDLRDLLSRRHYETGPSSAGKSGNKDTKARNEAMKVE
ncbi:hypothetical protein BCR34DRAFT_642851 [Clohesyomyces aquaticus]|uniref:Uncharacterized protein n=1 Tax=Clohesyomyces aquaticus TaxID=1231657 RepID=A0A1Y2A055_9PLEO|nr:hypothetical protein BCR34DRAFT_642851 [Clohesyomyces aquaticus]